MGNGFLLIIVGLLLFYIVISDKFYCVEGFLSCLGGKYVPGDGVAPAQIGGAVGATIPTIGGVIGLGK